MPDSTLNRRGPQERSEHQKQTYQVSVLPPSRHRGRFLQFSCVLYASVRFNRLGGRSEPAGGGKRRQGACHRVAAGAVQAHRAHVRGARTTPAQRRKMACSTCRSPRFQRSSSSLRRRTCRLHRRRARRRRWLTASWMLSVPPGSEDLRSNAPRRATGKLQRFRQDLHGQAWHSHRTPSNLRATQAPRTPISSSKARRS